MVTHYVRLVKDLVEAGMEEEKAVNYVAGAYTLDSQALLIVFRVCFED